MKGSWLLFLILPVTLFAQPCRYDQKIFSSFTKTTGVKYATAPGIPAIYLGESFTTSQNLTADIFEPVGDAASQRALIIFAHSGGFITGSKENQDMQALCDSFVKRGFVTASMDYRMNFNLLSGSSAERAVWRGTQDGSALVRFFKANAATYKIDTNKIFFWGSSAGSFIALHLAYADDSERPASTFSSPDLGCKDCSGIINRNTSSIAGIISCWGAIGDTNWIGTNNQTPAILFHGTADATVPYIQGSPFGLGTLPNVAGSKLINDRLNNINLYHELNAVTGEGHEYWGTSNGTFTASFPTPYWQDIITKSKLFMLGRMGLSSCNTLSMQFDFIAAQPKNDGVLLNWSMVEEPQPGDRFLIEYSLDARNWLSAGTSIVSTSGRKSFSYLHNFPNNSSIFYRIILNGQSAGRLISKIVALKPNSYNSFSVFPNPAHQNISVKINDHAFVAKPITLFNAIGNRILTFLPSGTITNLPLNQLSTGVYYLKQQGSESSVKLIVQ